MGKAKPQRKTGTLASNQPYNLSNTASTREKFQLSELEQNLSSPNDSARLNSLSILSDLYKFNSKNSKIFKLLSSTNFLSKLLIRLVDHNPQVVKTTSYCLKSISDQKDEESIENLIETGIFKSILSKVINSSLDSDIEIEIVQSYLYTISNIIFVNSQAINEIVEENSPFIHFLINLLINPSCDLRLLNTVCNVLITLTKIQSDILINKLLGASCVQEIIKLLKGLVTKKLGSASLKAENVELKTEDYDLWVLVIQSIEMLTNLFLNPILSSEIEQLIPISYIHQVQFHLLDACKIQYVPNPQPVYENNVEYIEEDDMDSDLMNMHEVSEKLSSKSSSNPSAGVSIMCDVEIMEMISDLIASSTQQVLSILPEINEETKNKNAIIASLQASPLYIRCINFLNIFESSFDMNKCLNIILNMKNKFYLCLVDNEDTSSCVKKYITPDGVRIMEAVEKLISSINESIGLKSYLLEINHSNIPSFNVDLNLYGEYFSFLYESVTNTTTLVSKETKKTEEKWKAIENNEEKKIKKIFCIQSSLFFDIFSSYLSNSYNNKNITNKIVLNNDTIKNILVNLLSWLNFPQYEVLLSLVNCLNFFISEEVMLTFKEVYQSLLSFLLSNSVLNRLNDSYCFQIDTFEEEENNGQGQEEEEEIKENKNIKNLTVSKLLLSDLLVNFFIDFHSSDDLSLFQTYHKLNSTEKLKNIYQKFSSFFKKNKKFLNINEKEKIMESLENLEAFIQYKINFSA